MPIQRLPNDPSLEQFKNQAETLHQFVRAGVPQALDMVHEFHPRTPDSTHFSRADAQLVVARRHGFASWPKLRTYLEVITRYSRAPHQQPVGGPVTTEPELVDELLRLACLTHGDDHPGRWRQAAALLASHPEITTASIHVAAAVGDIAATGQLLAQDRSLAGREGGAHRWAPLLYLAYSTIDDRVEGRSHKRVAGLLLEAGADPNAGYLWEGLPSPYTALTGALTSGHSEPIELARLLLEGGADPNDAQALYELWFPEDVDDPTSLELLFEFGLGTGRGGVWHARLGPALATPSQLVEDELIKSAAGNWPRRLRVVLDHPVDAVGLGSGHPVLEGLTAYELAVMNGHAEVVEILDAAGVRPDQPDPERDFLGACMRGDRVEVARLRAADPGIVARAQARRPHQISVAADRDRLDAVMLMVELGFDVNAAYRWPHEQTALHGAAYNGNLEMVKFLVEHGADPTLEDCSFQSTPLGWAEHTNQQQVVEYLRGCEPGRG